MKKEIIQGIRPQRFIWTAEELLKMNPHLADKLKAKIKLGQNSDKQRRPK